MSSMSSSSMSMSSMSTMPMVFTTSHHTPLYGNGWTPSTSGGYAGTCIFLVFLAIGLRLVFAAKAVCEQRWAAAAQRRRFVLVKGRPTEAGRIDQDPDAKTGALITVNGVEENVKVVQARGVFPAFRLSVDVPRAILTTIIAAMAYLLMLAVMTMNVGYFLSVLLGVFLGELAVGRYARTDEHFH
ncbi:uncharacterized protein Z520_10618 [Fonsecaea multimorphosa CBS 102226]|uniref:Copper transport protein n=1 Tax=Fonsecaea multimorphosa CBS 102226 TaxID=1442371 RepID=A0A0D2JKB2_9EURO|nr:uncharacterized protein Z520_10618 [Fonsecaea multimorphosa CBS 102226]KIX93712.1 hypothetical protein Z520_10618 [Fonsecaea multimorphosa CBS 102226]OAL19821.1 hypothetical protein AYO22_09348 [Fonsecaea multimorphosa]